MAPRVVPDLWLLKIFLLLAASWAVVVTIVMSSIFVPLLTGRIFLLVMLFPQWLMHDPLCFFIGAIWWASVIMFAKKTDVLQLLRRCRESLMKLSRATVVRVAVDTLLWQLTQLAAGVVLKLPGVDSLSELPLASFLADSSCLGGAIASFLLLLVLSGVLDLPARGIGIVNPLADWAEAMATACRGMCDALLSGRFDADSLQLAIIEERLIFPSFDAICINSARVVILAAAFVGIVHSIYVTFFEPEFTHSLRTIIWLFGVRTPAAFLACYWLSKIWTPAGHAWLKMAYQSVRDEHYLIGRRLMTHSNHAHATEDAQVTAGKGDTEGGKGYDAQLGSDNPGGSETPSPMEPIVEPIVENVNSTLSATFDEHNLISSH